MLYELNNIVRCFKGRNVLNIPELQIEPESIYTLIGPNGAGKTTLLNILAFLDEPTSGDLFFNNERVSYSAKKVLGFRRRVVLLDQYPILFTGPVWKNVEYGLKVRGVGKSERHKCVRDMLDLVGMTRFVEADAHKLSGGETKRVALARALALEPQVLLCDEPGANVDKENQEIILSILAEINKRSDTSIIFSTHYLSQGRRLADHTLMLEHGMLSDVVNENVFRVTVVGKEGGRVLCQVAKSVLLRLPAEAITENCSDFKLQVNPDKVKVVSNDLLGKKNILSGHVVQVNQDRGRVRVGIDLGIKLYFFISMEEYIKNPPIIGGKIYIDIPDKAIRCIRF